MTGTRPDPAGQLSCGPVTRAWQRACEAACIMTALPAHVEDKTRFLTAVLNCGMAVAPRLVNPIVEAATARLAELPPLPTTLLNFLFFLHTVDRTVPVDRDVVASATATLWRLRQDCGGWGLEPGDVVRLPITCATLMFFERHSHPPADGAALELSYYWALDEWRREMTNADGLPFKAAMALAAAAEMQRRGIPLRAGDHDLISETVDLLESSQLPSGAYTFFLRRSTAREHYPSAHHTARVVSDIGRALEALPGEHDPRLERCLHRGIDYLLATQLPCNTWPAQHNQTLVGTQVMAIQGLHRARRLASRNR